MPVEANGKRNKPARRKKAGSGGGVGQKWYTTAHQTTTHRNAEFDTQRKHARGSCRESLSPPRCHRKYVYIERFDDNSDNGSMGSLVKVHQGPPTPSLHQRPPQRGVSGKTILGIDATMSTRNCRKYKFRNRYIQAPALSHETVGDSELAEIVTWGNRGIFQNRSTAVKSFAVARRLLKLPHHHRSLRAAGAHLLGLLTLVVGSSCRDIVPWVAGHPYHFEDCAGTSFMGYLSVVVMWV